MANKKLMLIVNPMAGKGKFKASLGEILEVFFAGGYLPSVYFTQARYDAAGYVSKNAPGYDLVVCMGGDGTLSEVVTGLMALEPSRIPILGYIPMGTANDIANTLDLPRNPRQAAVSILEGKPFPLDVGRFGRDHYFTYIAAFGAFTEVSYKTPQESKQVWGHLAYIFEGMTRLPKIRHYQTRVEYDGGVISQELAFGGVTNSTTVAGLVKLDEAIVELNDGLFEVILIKNPQSVGDMNGIVADLLSQNYTGSNLNILHSKHVRFSFDEPVAWTRDGEDGGIHTEVTLENCNRAIRIIA